MKKYASACMAFLLCATAHAEALEPPIESSPLATIAFIVLFVGFCVGFAWMVWRNKGKKK